MAFVVAIVAGALAVVLATKNKLGAAVLASFVAAISLFIAFPQALTPDWLNLGQTGTIIIGLLGVIGLLLAVAIKQIPTGLAVLGLLVSTWALCRLVPTLPPAFANLAPKLGTASDIIWEAIKVFFQDAIPG